MHIREKLMDVEGNYTYYAIMADQGRMFRKVLETISAVAAAMTGLQFVAAGYVGREDNFFPMMIVAPAWVWGTLMLTLAVVRVVILVVNGWWPHSHRARKQLSGLFIFGVWLPLGACSWWTFMEHFMSGGLMAYPGLAYSMFTLGTEFLIFYAHATFVYAARKT